MVNREREKKIERAHQEWMAALDSVEDPIFMHDKAFRILRCNRAYQQRAGLPFKEIIGRPYYELFPKSTFPPHDPDSPAAEEREEEITADGSLFRSRSYPVTDDKGAYLYSVHTLEDITERRRTEEALKESELRFKTIFEKAHDGILLADTVNKTFISGNARICKMLGYRPEELVSLSVSDIHPPEALSYVIKQFEKQARGEIELVANLPVRRKDGSIFHADISSFPIVLSGKEYLAGFFRDISDRRAAEVMLHETEDRYNAIFENVLDGIGLADIESMQIVDGNPALCHMLGYAYEELISLHISDLHPRKKWPAIAKKFKKQADDTLKLILDIPMKRKDGSIFYADINTSRLYIGNKGYMVGVFRDITERKEAEIALRRADRALRTLSAGNLALVKAESREALLQEVVDIIVEKGGYSLATVCYAENDSQKSLTPMAWSGTEENLFWNGKPSWANTQTDLLPAARAIHDNATQICREIKGECGFKPWMDAALSHGYRSSIALPLSDNGHTFGVLCIYSCEPESFDEEEVELLEELANDLSYGISTLRTRAEHEQHAALLRQSLEQSIQTIAATVEARDPYTAGHQRRVAELATAIAREMELDDEQIEGIHFAAIIHDLGKIHIPAEILAKPGKLSEIEYMLIQTHPRDGYEILKNVAFPWPIAEIIRQHHEKLDGSGYPQGLKGDAILLEARIIAVADVVEAMSTHRPYRPSLGIYSALEEINQGRGNAYDPAVVDACLVLFTKKGFEFNGAASS